MKMEIDVREGKKKSFPRAVLNAMSRPTGRVGYI